MYVGTIGRAFIHTFSEFASVKVTVGNWICGYSIALLDNLLPYCWETWYGNIYQLAKECFYLFFFFGKFELLSSLKPAGYSDIILLFQLLQEKEIIFGLSQVAYGGSLFIGYWAYFFIFKIVNPTCLFPFR
jgi:hypothetical protein